MSVYLLSYALCNRINFLKNVPMTHEKGERQSSGPGHRLIQHSYTCRTIHKHNNTTVHQNCKKRQKLNLYKICETFSEQHTAMTQHLNYIQCGEFWYIMKRVHCLVAYNKFCSINTHWWHMIITWTNSN